MHASARLPPLSYAAIMSLGVENIVVMASTDGLEFVLSTKHLLSRLLIVDELNYVPIGTLAENIAKHGDIIRSLSAHIKKEADEQEASSIQTPVANVISTNDNLLLIRALYYIVETRQITDLGGYDDNEWQLILTESVDEALRLDQVIKDLHYQVYVATKT